MSTVGTRRRANVAGLRHRGQDAHTISSRNWQRPPSHLTRDMASDVVLDMGWGRLVFGHTFTDQRDVVDALRAEESGERDIAMYVPEPQVLVGLAPHELFMDPSITFRLPLARYRPPRDRNPDVFVRMVRDRSELEHVNRLYAANGMVTSDPDVMWANHRTRTFTYLVAEDTRTRAVVGTVTGVDHVLAFGDPDEGASLWCLAADPQSAPRGTGEALVRVLAERYVARGRAILDLSVLHDNDGAIALYRRLGFRPAPPVVVKRKNPINRPLFSPQPERLGELNPYARIIADEALRRGVRVEVTDAPSGEMRLTFGGRSLLTRESLSELTSAVAMSRCDDKRVTRRLLAATGVRVPRGVELAAPALADGEGLAAAERLIAETGPVVVKPARGEQGKGITIGVRDAETLRRAVAEASANCPDVLVEEFVTGQDLRIVVIDHEVVAAAVRRPAAVIGTGSDDVRTLVVKQSRRRQAATGGESSIPLDDTTEAVVHDAGFGMDDVLPRGERLEVRRTANLHTGGTIEDVTDDLHPDLVDAAVAASRALGIPVTGLDLLVPDVSGPEHVVIEANERPGLANHQPRPTAQRFLDLLFPETRRVEQR
ncbi:N-acetylglutaminylglutamine synthetase [Paenibacillus sp. TRM 82003]|uniref:N-acetylglutaminylglutamine synthetase n=1 Tax=Kineococcus sp. TRM81007 TaxID=2925831 RepID=UPI001F5A9000|nr:N-acetylglutaminylglutamine synthetase [Kineococcus sp. TRM81007]MCI2240103.1 N-acetylglutaminylglutamine synthetase [Kineococcus sp. TRM81007]MCI3925591.1 N-acetylglutaminylglutamine synthetase [Paenibacillus sp. TRM 82003]